MRGQRFESHYADVLIRRGCQISVRYKPITVCRVSIRDNLLGKCSGQWSTVLYSSRAHRVPPPPDTHNFMSVHIHSSICLSEDGQLAHYNPHAVPCDTLVAKQEYNKPSSYQIYNPQMNRYPPPLFTQVCWRRQDSYTATNQSWQTTNREPDGP